MHNITLIALRACVFSYFAFSLTLCLSSSLYLTGTQRKEGTQTKSGCNDGRQRFLGQWLASRGIEWWLLFAIE